MTHRDNSLKAADLVRSALQDLVYSHTDTFEAMRARCDSPIEELFLAGLMAASFRHADCIEFREGGPLNGPAPIRPTCYQQVRISEYKVDFLIVRPSVSASRNVVVECDGREYHALVQEQTSRDRERDAFLNRTGYTVLRFTGAELNADAYRCGYEVLKMAVLT
jgi:hypothetical protein